MDRNQTLINEWVKTTNLSFLISDIFVDIDNASYFFGQSLDEAAFTLDEITFKYSLDNAFRERVDTETWLNYRKANRV